MVHRELYDLLSLNRRDHNKLSGRDVAEKGIAGELRTVKALCVAGVGQVPAADHVQGDSGSVLQVLYK